MRCNPLRLAFISLSVVFMCALLGRAEVPLKDLTQARLREWVGMSVASSRAAASKAAFWKRLDTLIVVDSQSIFYKKSEAGKPLNVVWWYRPQNGKALSPDEQVVAEAGLLTEFSNAVGQYRNMGTLLSSDDYAELMKVFRSAEGSPSELPAPVPSDDLGRLHGELDGLRRRVERLEQQATAPSQFIMVVQPSSMIYYDFYNRCWLPGPAQAVFYPVPSEGVDRVPLRLSSSSERTSPTAVASQQPAGSPPEIREDQAARCFWLGYRDYWHGDYDKALASFQEAIRLNAQDARYWYYEALAERQLGQEIAAQESARRGRELHLAIKPQPDLVAASLERVQGRDRDFLNVPVNVATDAAAGR